jgi:hypothetical protein
MGLEYRNLDERTRTLMLAEMKRDIAEGTLYVSENLDSPGQADYRNLILDAARSGSDMTLGEAIKDRLKPYGKPRRLKSGKLSKPPLMPSNAHEVLSEGEFNRFYIRALCLRAIEDGILEVIVYRAKPVRDARPESEQKIGQRVPVETLLRDLRTHPGVDTALGLPAGPNSGLCVRLP